MDLRVGLTVRSLAALKLQCFSRAFNEAFSACEISLSPTRNWSRIEDPIAKAPGAQQLALFTAQSPADHAGVTVTIRLRGLRVHRCGC